MKAQKQVDNKGDRSDAPPATKDSNGNMKDKRPLPPPTPPPPGSEKNAEEDEAMNIMNSNSFLDKLVDQLVLRLDTRKKEQERKEKVGIILSQLS